MENSGVRSLKPMDLWNHFADINAIPRGSKKEEQIIAYMLEFGKKLGLNSIKDEVGNVIIKKPATQGMENRKTVVLQSHLDMVHQKNSDTQFDFDREGIKMHIEEDWVKADGTTLGADNGIGVAAIMAVLSSDGLQHPAIEALFTIDEETGMTGAKGLQAGYLNGEILLNLDTEEDDEIDIGCAGGIDVTAERSFDFIKLTDDFLGYELSVTGLKGGHSGMDIHLGLGNANKILAELFLTLNPYIYICKVQSGGLRNAIPREGFARVACKTEDREEMLKTIMPYIQRIQTRFAEIEPDLKIELTEVKPETTAMTKESQSAFTSALSQAINGVFKMSEDIPDLVEASNNIAKVLVENGRIVITNLTRSSVEESKMKVANLLKEVFTQGDFTVVFSGSYPGWSPNPDSPILKVVESVYLDLFKTRPKVVACHAGLECGILGTNYPKMDMISFGPTIKGAHSPDERAKISSVDRFWGFLKEILRNIPETKVSKT